MLSALGQSPRDEENNENGLTQQASGTGLLLEPWAGDFDHWDKAGPKSDEEPTEEEMAAWDFEESGKQLVADGWFGDLESETNDTLTYLKVTPGPAMTENLLSRWPRGGRGCRRLTLALVGAGIDVTCATLEDEADAEWMMGTSDMVEWPVWEALRRAWHELQVTRRRRMEREVREMLSDSLPGRKRRRTVYQQNENDD